MKVQVDEEGEAEKGKGEGDAEEAGIFGVRMSDGSGHFFLEASQLLLPLVLLVL